MYILHLPSFCPARALSFCRFDICPNCAKKLGLKFDCSGPIFASLRRKTHMDGCTEGSLASRGVPCSMGCCSETRVLLRAKSHYRVAAISS